MGLTPLLRRTPTMSGWQGAFLIPAIHAPHASVWHRFGAHPMALRRKIAGEHRLVHHPPQGRLGC
jgi:hypothetical protein